MHRKCVVKNCKREDSDTFHRIPKDPDQRNIWLDLLDLPETVNGRVCSKHFEQSDFEAKGERVWLKPHACPMHVDDEFPKFASVMEMDEDMYMYKNSNKNMASRKSFIKTEKEEPGEYFILSTPDNETIIGSPNDAYSHNGTISDEMFNAVIKEEPVYDISNCDDEEYLIEDSETDQTHESSSTTNKSTESKKRRTKTNPAQFQKLIAYMRCNAADFNRDNRRLDQATPFRIDDIWESITTELNAIGPPFRTNAQWRRAWTVYKSNKRRRKPGNKEMDDGENKRMRFESRLLSDGLDASNAMSSKNCVHDTAADDNIPNSKINDDRLNLHHFHSEILKKMDLVCQQQIQQTSQLEKLNRNLEKLIEVVAEKFP